MVTVKGSANHRIKKDAKIGAAGTLVKGRVDILHGSYVRIDAVPAGAAQVKAAQLGLTNPVSLAWELLPFSFVVDWAWPLGDYFSNLDALYGWEIRGYSQSNLTRARWTYTGVDNATTSDAWTNAYAGYRYLTRLNRGTNGGQVPFPVFPRPKDPFNSKEHVASALSLLATVFNWR
jgi:hypothetical protein